MSKHLEVDYIYVNRRHEHDMIMLSLQAVMVNIKMYFTHKFEQ